MSLNLQFKKKQDNFLLFPICFILENIKEYKNKYKKISIRDKSRELEKRGEYERLTH